MSDSVHLLIPFASCRPPGSVEALRGMALPHLEKLLARLAQSAEETGDEHSLSMPHERVMARSCGLAAADGLIPWAALQLQRAGHDSGNAAWAWITPCHWRVATDHVVMTNPLELELDERESQALLNAMLPYFEQDGMALEYDAPTRWLARAEVFRELATASLDRVIGRRIDDWMPRTPPARPLRRLQQEMQMLLYTHEINEARVARSLAPVNSFWVSGAGALPPGDHAVPTGLQLIDSLRGPALQEDWPAWAAAWRQLDSQECARLVRAFDEGQAVTLTLSGERNARTWSGRQSGFLQRIAGRFKRMPVSPQLEAL